MCINSSPIVAGRLLFSKYFVIFVSISCITIQTEILQLKKKQGGLCPACIPQRLLEDNVIELQAASDKARSIDDAQSYTSSSVAVSGNQCLSVNPPGFDQHAFVNEPK